MPPEYTRWLGGAGICLFLALTLGCGGSTPVAPTPSPAAAPVSTDATPLSSAPRVWTISPNAGTTGGGTPLLIHGEGFEPGATLTLDGAATQVTVLSSTMITAASRGHAAGTVDVVVTNPGGQSGRLKQGYTYAVVVVGPAPTIEAVTPNTGTAGAGGPIRITGTGFQPGAIVRLDDTPLRTYPFEASPTTLGAQVSAHPPGVVDVIVVNPDGQGARLRAGYRYAEPGTLDFNGEWRGEADDLRDNHSGTKIHLTVRNNTLVSVTCYGGVDLTMATPTTLIMDDEFSFNQDDRLLVSGRFVSADTAVGRINIPPCGLTWVAHKQR